MSVSGPGLLATLGLSGIFVALAWAVDVVVRAAAQGKIGVNSVVGLRLRRTMATAESWTMVHRAASFWTRSAAWGVSGISIVTVGASRYGLVVVAGLGVMAVLLLAGVVLGTVRGLKALSDLRDE